MPPKTVPKTAPARSTGGGKGKGKGKGKNRKRHKLNLKGWLKTAADWARFNAWAKINAEPKKIPEPEPIVRISKPLSYFKKRLLVLAIPHIHGDPSAICRTDLSVSKAALKAKPSKRVRQLAKFIEREMDCGRQFPIRISRAALRYKATARLIEISQPSLREPPEECRTLEVSRRALRHKTTKREAEIAMAKLMISCPGVLSDEERELLMTPNGVMKSALTYKLTPWMEVLILPSYKFLKDRKDETAEEWKELLLEEGEKRGKAALEEERKREAKERDAARGKKGKVEQKADGDEEEKKRKVDEENEGETVNDAEASKDEGGGDSKEQDGEKNEEEDKEKEEKAKKKREERNAWRLEPSPCKDNPFEIKKSALNTEASERTKELAKPNIHENKSCRTNASAVKKSALNATASARIVEIAKPMRPKDPVERPPPREKDKYGSPIYPKPRYGKRMPKVEPYKMGECKSEEDKEKERKELEEKNKKEKPIDKIAFAPTIDPCFDPRGAKKQMEARKDLKAREKRERERKKENATSQDTAEGNAQAGDADTGTAE